MGSKVTYFDPHRRLLASFMEIAGETLSKLKNTRVEELTPQQAAERIRTMQAFERYLANLQAIDRETVTMEEIGRVLDKLLDGE